MAKVISRSWVAFESTLGIYHELTRYLLKTKLILQIRLKRGKGQGHSCPHDSYEADHQADAAPESLGAQPRHGHTAHCYLLPAEINQRLILL